MAPIAHLLAAFAATITTVTALTIRDAFPIAGGLSDSKLFGEQADDFNCQSSHNPVVLLHSLGASRDLGLNLLAKDLRSNGYCTFSITYGAQPLLPWIGGLVDMDKSAAEIAAYIGKVADRTGKKVDVVGHSEGGAQALYVPLTQPGVATKLERVVALAPAVYGADYFGVTGLLDFFGPVVKGLAQAAIGAVGCQACVDMIGGNPPGKVYKRFRDAGEITQDGNKVTIIMSRTDTLVPPEKSEVEEDGVRNVIVQDSCADDPVGHFGLAWDKGVWGLVKNALTEEYDAKIVCDKGIPL